ncbi:MAG: L-2-amino-thiazoline-4-carboxylic acid hydrolase [bacterium]|nr:L-2-amino-thiazoline-4-carboxylic acid hydrolase [bacterium]
MKKTLLAEFENDNIVRLLDILWNLYEDIPEFPAKDASRSVGWLLSSARKSIALYRTFLEMGLSDETAKKYIERVNWELGKNIGAPLYYVSRIRGKNPVRRIHWINDALWKFLFTEPFKRVPAESDASVAFNITRCPFQEYYTSQNLPELCEFASCSQDHLLAKAWHSTFQRTQTLAGGGDYCDFRFYTSDRD